MYFVMEIEELKGFIVKRLYRRGYIGSRHTAIEHLQKGLPWHIRGTVSEAMHELVKEDLLLLKPTSYGLHVSLNQRKRKEIERYLK